MSNLCVICARGGSQGIKNKALVKIKGKPLFHIQLSKQLNLEFLVR